MPDTVSTPADPTIHDRPIRPARPRASLVVAMLGFFVVALEAQIVSVVCPASVPSWAPVGLGGSFTSLP